MNNNYRNILILFGLSALLVSLILYAGYSFIRISIVKKEETRRQDDFAIKKISSGQEKCLNCHFGENGFEKSHNPEVIGCVACHLGNPNAELKKDAHLGMIIIPGNASNAEKTCGRTGCHPQMIARMQNNIMNTMNGVVSVDKWVFDESETPTFKSPIQLIGLSHAEKHLRNLCASCHLSNEKTELGPITELSRGGGCLACHLNYTNEAKEKLNDYLSKKANLQDEVNLASHPQINLSITNLHCFGCHSRSGRISLSYDGWHETMLTPDNIKGKVGFRLLDDGRIVKQIQKDVHSEKGMLCVDCHTSYEIMGDGSYALHKEEQMKVQCVDCHLINQPKTQKFNEFDFESKKISELLNLDQKERDYLTVSKNGFPLINSYYENGLSKLIRKSSKAIAIAKSPASVCVEGKAHKDLSCNSCHSSWTPQCIGCHTEYDENSTMYDLLSNKEEKGEWIEFGTDFKAEPATLGVKEQRDSSGRIQRIIDEFTPGMILTIDKKDGSKKLFKRLFAPAFSHTIRKEARSCESCHQNSLAIGYGRGKLKFVVNGQSGNWKFEPEFSVTKEDGLPKDAWIGFLSNPKKNIATREYARPFDLSEQKRILAVGSCLVCHKSSSQIMKAAMLDFAKILQLKSSKCITLHQ